MLAAFLLLQNIQFQLKNFKITEAYFNFRQRTLDNIEILDKILKLFNT